MPDRSLHSGRVGEPPDHRRVVACFYAAFRSADAVSRPKLRSRRQMRELALRVLFEIDVGKQPLPAALARVQPDVPESEWPFVRALTEGTWAHRAEIDRALTTVTTEWSVERLASTDRSILRMAAYELQHLDTPARVVINEAVELAKRYGTDDSGKFVNGVLGALYRALEKKSDNARA
jgi:N utilization substance protein B